MSDNYQYSVLRVIPNKRRGECVNVGLVVFFNNKIDVRVLPSLNKVRAIDGKVDLSQIFELPELLNEWIEPNWSIDEKHKLKIRDVHIF